MALIYIKLYKQISCSHSWARNYSTLATPRASVEKFKLDPWWFTGFADGEGCFSINIIKDCKRNTGYQVQPSFSIGLHKKDKPLLQQIKTSLKVGLIFQQGSEAIRLCVQSIKELQAIINHFDKYSLNTDKCTNYKLLKQAFKHIVAREHLTHEGLKKNCSN